MNAARLWAHQPYAHAALLALMAPVTAGQGLDLRQRGILVLASAATLRDSYCSLAWGAEVAAAAGPDLSAAVLTGRDEGPTDQERALGARPDAEIRDTAPTEVLDAVTHGRPMADPVG